MCNLAACNDSDGPVEPARVLTTINVSVGAGTIEVGEQAGAIATGVDQAGGPIDPGALTWSSDQPNIAAVNPTTGLVFGLTPGTAHITATTASGKTGDRSVTVVRAAHIRINEVQPRDGVPNGWVEFFNPTTAAVDMSDWTLIDDTFFGGSYTFPAGSVIQSGGFLVVEATALPFKLTAPDDLFLFSRFGVAVDIAFWPQMPETTYGRCPDGNAFFDVTKAATKGATNSCS